MTDAIITDGEIDELERTRAEARRSVESGDINGRKLSVDYLEELYAAAPRLIAAVREARAELSRANARIAELGAALEPFASAAESYDVERNSEVAWGHDFTIGAIRRAARALQTQKAPPANEGATGRDRRAT